MMLGELGGDVLVVLGEVVQGVLQVDVIFVDVFFYGVEEKYLQVVVVDGELGYCVVCVEVLGFGEDGIVMVVVEVEFLGFDVGFFEGFEEIEIVKNLLMLV